jgi:hypothetical protein
MKRSLGDIVTYAIEVYFAAVVVGLLAQSC